VGIAPRLFIRLLMAANATHIAPALGTSALQQQRKRLKAVQCNTTQDVIRRSVAPLTCFAHAVV